MMLEPRCGKPASYPNPAAKGGPCMAPVGHHGTCNPNRTRCGMCDADWPSADGKVHHGPGCLAQGFHAQGHYANSRIEHVFAGPLRQRVAMKADLVVATMKNAPLYAILAGADMTGQNKHFDNRNVVTSVDNYIDAAFPPGEGDFTDEVRAARESTLATALAEGIESDSGWLAPSGEFYGCKSWQHVSLAKDIADHLHLDGDAEFAMESLGWLKVTKGSWLTAGHKAPTQPQRDTIFDWCLKHDRSNHYDRIIRNLENSAL